MPTIIQQLENRSRLNFQTDTIRWVLGVPPVTLKNRTFFTEPTWMCLRRVSGGTPRHPVNSASLKNFLRPACFLFGDGCHKCPPYGLVPFHGATLNKSNIPGIATRVQIIKNCV